MESKVFTGFVKAIGSDDDRTVQHLVSVFNVVDHGGDAVYPGAFSDAVKAVKSGLQLPSYWSHNMADPDMNLGVVVDLDEVLPGDPRLFGVGGEAEKNGGLLASIKYDKTEKADRVLELIKAGRVKQSSYTYDVTDGEYISAKSDTTGMGQHYALRKLDVLEIGSCQLGMNSDTTLVGIKSRQAAMREKAAARTVADKGALPLSVGPAKCVDGAWDGPGTESGISADASAAQLAAFYAWRGEGDATAKSDYRFIHHGLGDDGHAAAANLKACITGIGVLNGGRGGSTIPEADVKGVYAHLAAHIREAGQEPPGLKAREVSLKDYTPAPYHADVDETVKCANCGKMNDDDARFCDQCGHSLTGAGDATVEGKSRDSKAGRTLSGKNEADLKSAMDHHAKGAALIGGVLASVAGTDDSTKAAGGTEDQAAGGPEEGNGTQGDRSTETKSVDLLSMELELLELDD